MTWNVVLFDLDGTLTDSEPGVVNGIVHAMAQMGKVIPPETNYRKFLGPPLSYSFRNYLDLNEHDAVAAIEIYRDYYHETGRFENSVYPGIVDLLQRLTDENKRIAVATSKVEYSAESIVHHFDLQDYFEFVVGCDEHGTHRGTKGLVIQEALTRLKVSTKDSVVMIGDREHDIYGAKENDIESIGVLWGYGGHEELAAAGAQNISDSTLALTSLLFNRGDND